MKVTVSGRSDDLTYFDGEEDGEGRYIIITLPSDEEVRIDLTYTDCWEHSVTVPDGSAYNIFRTELWCKNDCFMEPVKASAPKCGECGREYEPEDFVQ